MGYVQTDLERLCRVLNAIRSPYQFEHCTAIANVGNPDLYGFAYSLKAFSDLLGPYRDHYNVCVALTSVPIEDNFFTRTIPHSLIVATFHQADEMVKTSGRTREEYAAMAICQELVSFEFQRVTGLDWDDLFHPDPRGCLFDFAGIKTQKIAKLTECSICDACIGKLSSTNVDQRVVQFATALLARIRKPSLAKALRMCVTGPSLSFVYGGLVIGAAVNLFTSVIMNDGPITALQRNFTWAMSSSVFLFPAAVYMSLRVRELRRHIR